MERACYPRGVDPGPDDERALALRAQRGDRDAFAALYRRHAPRLYARILVPRLGDRSAAEDALAETFRKALEQLPGWRPHPEGLGPWLTRIAIREAANVHRARTRTGRSLARFDALLGPLREEGDGPGAALDRRQREAWLEARREAVMAALSPRYRRALTLRLLEERSRAECAELLELRVGTFDVLLLRAVRGFRREWEAMEASPLPGTPSRTSTMDVESTEEGA